MTCACPELRVGSERTGVRNWSEQCPDHGYGTDWYRDKLRHDPTWGDWTHPPRADLVAAGRPVLRGRR